MREDCWIGVRFAREVKFFDEELKYQQPLQSIQSEEKTYADGSPFTDGKDFDFDIKKTIHWWKGPCVFLQARSDYQTFETDQCEGNMKFICKWNSKDLGPNKYFCYFKFIILILKMCLALMDTQPQSIYLVVEPV